jgi:hypothetical protein
MDWLDSILYHYINHYITVDVIVKGGVYVLWFLVCWTFWGKSWMMEQINEAGKKEDKDGE